MLTFQPYHVDTFLQPYIHSYWYMEAGNLGAIADLIPDGHPELVFSLNGAQALEINDKRIRFPKISLLGQLGSRAKTFLGAGDRLFFIKLYPWTPGYLFNAPGRLWTNNVTDIQTQHSRFNFSTLYSQLCNEQTIERLSICANTFFKIRWADFLQEQPFVHFAIKEIYRTSGTLSIDDLTNHIHASRRHVEKLFQLHIGMSPKQYARLIRVKKASLLLLKDNFNGSIRQIAAELDYYDPSHFLKDFKQIAEQTPSNFLRQKGQLSFLATRKEYLNQWDYS